MNIHGYKKKQQEARYNLKDYEQRLSAEKKKKHRQRDNDLVRHYQLKIKNMRGLIVSCDNKANHLRKTRDSHKKVKK